MLVFMVLYMIDVTGFFACLTALSRDGKPMETMDDFAGLMRERPGMALAMTAFAVSALGLPPFSGFWAQVLRVQGHHRRAATAWVAVVAPGRQRGGGLLLPAPDQGDVARPAGRRRRRRARRTRAGVAYAAALFAFPVVLIALIGLDPLAKTPAVGLRAGLTRSVARTEVPDPCVRRDRLHQRRGAPPRRGGRDAARSGSPRCARRAGRGRRGRAWETGEGNLAATYLMVTDRAPREAAQISFVAALAVADLAARLSCRPTWSSVKWPNDAAGRRPKLAGILVESGRASRPAALWLAVGVGVNLARAPVAAERPATTFAARHARAAAEPRAALDGLAAAFAALARGLGAAGLCADRRGLDRAGPRPWRALHRAAAGRDRRGRRRGPGRRRRASAALGGRALCGASPPATSSSGAA